MPSIDFFTDFVTMTGPSILTSPDEMINDAQLRNYELFDVMGRAKKAVQGGSSIKDVIFLNDPEIASNYTPGDAANVTNVQESTTITVPWRHTRAPMNWTEAEILLNDGSGGGKMGQFHEYKRVRDHKYRMTYTSLLNLIERDLVRTASNATMESSTGTKPYSVFASVTTDGLAPAGFTTVQGVNPTTESKWRNQTSSYTAATPYDTDNGIIAGFDTMAQLVHFKRPPNYKSYFTESEWRAMVVATNKEGRRDYMKALRVNNDITRAGPQDPAYGDPVFNNIPVRNVEGLDDQSSFTAGSPDYLFLNMNFLKLVFHRKKWFDMKGPFTDGDKPDTVVFWCDIWWNLFCCSRQRLGYLQAA